VYAEKVPVTFSAAGSEDIGIIRSRPQEEKQNLSGRVCQEGHPSEPLLTPPRSGL
jgi:hypothetical protein